MTSPKKIPAERMDEVAAELMAAVLACEEALDEIAMANGLGHSNGPVRDRMRAARAHITHARAIARAAGVFKPATRMPARTGTPRSTTP